MATPEKTLNLWYDLALSLCQRNLAIKRRIQAKKFSFHKHFKWPAVKAFAMTASYPIPVPFNKKPVNDDTRSEEDLPSKQLLLSIVRMGSLTSLPKNLCTDYQDDNLIFRPSNREYLLKRCQNELKELPKPFSRYFTRELKANCNDTVRILQWNHLSQTLEQKMITLCGAIPKH